jgi:hypothetical protein
MTRNMRGKMALVALAIMALGAHSSAATAGGFFGDRHEKGGFVKPCSLDGVNPVYHPDIFGNPAFARTYYGFVQGPDRTWRVMSNCHIW